MPTSNDGDKCFDRTISLTIVLNLSQEQAHMYVEVKCNYRSSVTENYDVNKERVIAGQPDTKKPAFKPAKVIVSWQLKHQGSH